MAIPTRFPGAPCWIDLFSSDTDRATAFYGGVLGWEAEPADPRFGGYFTFAKDGATVAGCMANDGSTGTPDGWTVYLQADDADAIVAAAPANGGSVEFPPMQVAEHGTMAIVVDPGGARVGVWQPAAVQGIERIAEPGTPAWFELHTTAYDAAVEFYRSVFGWTTRTMGDSDDFRYTVLAEGDGQRAGIMDASSYLGDDGRASGWTVYFSVEDADAAAAEVEALGGSIVQPPEDTPYGRLATVTDPTGTVFRLHQRSA